MPEPQAPAEIKISPELKKQIDDITQSVATFQAELTAVKGSQAEGSEFKVKSEKFETDIADSTQKLQDVVAKAEAEAQRLKDIELTVAKMVGDVESGSKEVKVADNIKKMYQDAIKKAPGSYAIEEAAVKANLEQHFNHYFKHMTDTQKELAVKTMLEGSDPNGGVFCPITLNMKITKRQFELTPMRQVATVLNTNSQAMKFILDDEDIETLSATEISTRAKTASKKFGEVKIDVHEKYAYPKASLVVLEDSVINLEDMQAKAVSNKFSRVDGTESINGDGVNGMRGILSYDEVDPELYQRFALGTMETGVATSIPTPADLINLQSHLLEPFQPNANWMFNRLMWAQITQLTDDNGAFLINPTLLFSGVKPQLLGAPVLMAPDLANTVTGGEKVALFGDFREGYTITDRIGISVIRDNITEPGMVKWNFRRRTGGGVTNFQAIKVLKIKS